MWHREFLPWIPLLGSLFDRLLWHRCHIGWQWISFYFASHRFHPPEIKQNPLSVTLILQSPDLPILFLVAYLNKNNIISTHMLHSEKYSELHQSNSRSYTQITTTKHYISRWLFEQLCRGREKLSPNCWLSLFDENTLSRGLISQEKKSHRVKGIQEIRTHPEEKWVQFSAGKAVVFTNAYLPIPISKRFSSTISQDLSFSLPPSFFLETGWHYPFLVANTLPLPLIQSNREYFTLEYRATLKLVTKTWYLSLHISTSAAIYFYLRWTKKIKSIQSQVLRKR